MKIVLASEASVCFYETARRHTPEGCLSASETLTTFSVVNGLTVVAQSHGRQGHVTFSSSLWGFVKNAVFLPPMQNRIKSVKIWITQDTYHLEWYMLRCIWIELDCC
jgi:hypothetical protein